MDYIDLNEACPKDSFPLPRIDQIVDASTGHAMFVIPRRLFRISPDFNAPA